MGLWTIKDLHSNKLPIIFNIRQRFPIFKRKLCHHCNRTESIQVQKKVMPKIVTHDSPLLEISIKSLSILIYQLNLLQSTDNKVIMHNNNEKGMELPLTTDEIHPPTLQPILVLCTAPTETASTILLWKWLGIPTTTVVGYLLPYLPTEIHMTQNNAKGFLPACRKCSLPNLHPNNHLSKRQSRVQFARSCKSQSQKSI